VHRSLFHTVHKCHRNLENVSKCFWREVVSRTETCNWFSNFRSRVTSDSNAKHSGYLHTWIVDDNVSQIKNLFMKTNMSVSATWPMNWESHYDNARAFWHKVWTCDRSPKNSCLISDVTEFELAQIGRRLRTSYHSRTGTVCTCLVQNRTSVNESNNSAVTGLTVSSFKGAVWKKGKSQTKSTIQNLY
jgi:hypothetical protein